jgi:hypothetical protein
VRHTISFDAECWVYQGPAAWHFVTVPAELGAELAHLNQAALRGQKRGWGSIAVAAQIGESQWNTSVFPDKKSDSYLLPLKSQIRTAQAIAPGSSVRVTLSIPMP